MWKRPAASSHYEMSVPGDAVEAESRATNAIERVEHLYAFPGRNASIVGSEEPQTGNIQHRQSWSRIHASRAYSVDHSFRFGRVHGGCTLVIAAKIAPDSFFMHAYCRTGHHDYEMRE